MKKNRLIITAMSLSLMLLCACGDDPDRDAIPTAATTATTTEATTEEIPVASGADADADTTEAKPQIAEDFELIPGTVEGYTRDEEKSGSHAYYDGYFVSKCFKYLYSPIGAYKFRYFIESTDTTNGLDRNDPEALVAELKKPAAEDTASVEFRDFAMTAISSERSGFEIDVAANISYIPKDDQIKPPTDIEKDAADKMLKIAKGLYTSAELKTEEFTFMDQPVNLYIVNSEGQNVTGYVFFKKGEYLCRISVSVTSGYKTDAEGNPYVPDMQKALPLIKTELNGFESL